ncbi:unnamed protein product [Musa hybrid cultivar]
MTQSSTTQPRIVPEPGDFRDGDNNQSHNILPTTQTAHYRVVLAWLQQGEARKKRAFEEERSIKKEGEALRKSIVESSMRRHQRLDEPEPIKPRRELVFHALSQSRFNAPLPRRS